AMHEFQSSIIPATVFHKRFMPREHQFRYPYLLFAFHLTELESGSLDNGLFAYNRSAPLALHCSDYLKEEEGTISEKLAVILSDAGQEAPGHVMLVTVPRWLGHHFNPVSFYFCYGSAKETEALSSSSLQCVVCEVSNTFGDRSLYVLPAQPSEDPPYTFTAQKMMHVSPFNNMKGDYTFRMADLRERCNISITLERDGERVLVATLHGDLLPWSRGKLAATLAKAPFTLLLSLPRIHVEAVKLWVAKRLTFFSRPAPDKEHFIRVRHETALEGFFRRRLLAVLKELPEGSVVIDLPDGTHQELGLPEASPRGHIRVLDPRFFSRVALHGDIGFGEAYTRGFWESDDLNTLLTTLLRNYSYITLHKGQFSVLSAPLGALLKMLRRNTPTQSRTNIREHYDISNGFFELMLDSTMMYSSAQFKDPQWSLERAQQYRIGKFIKKLRLTAADHLLEIGCGWGGFAVAAAKTTGCRVTAVTISEAQASYVRQRVQRESVGHLVQVVNADYRELTGQFTKIISIEMLEAVGRSFLPTYFKALDRLLASGGLVALQFIAIPDQRYKRYVHDFDWIRKHIFPGGGLLSLNEVSSILKNHTSFYIEHLENIGPDYGLTIGCWQDNFEANMASVEALGFDESFIRTWRYYLSSTRAMFDAGQLQDLQLVLARPGTEEMSARESVEHI
ncbi:DUF1365 family protein, partial [Myxococcota bacterium]|nr:DUF1365 family protein [Myxococcota bacterium]